MPKYTDDYDKSKFEAVLRKYPDSNLAKAYNLYVDPRTTLRVAGGYGSINGWVDPEKAPLTANIAAMRPSTIAHEAAHVQQNLANQYDIRTPKNRTAPVGRQVLSGLTALLSGLREKYPELVGDNLGDSSREILANLQGIEAALPEGTNILDTIDLPPAYRRLLELRMFPNSDKVLESEYEKPQPGLQGNESIFQYIQRRLK